MYSDANESGDIAVPNCDDMILQKRISPRSVVTFCMDTDCTDVAAPYQSKSCSIPLVLDQWLVIRANWLHVLTTEQLQFGI